MQKHQFLAIGDTTLDTFIRLKDAEVHCTINREKCELCVRFGDKVPFESVEEVPAVGNAANAAVAAARLGLTSALIAHVGEDAVGREALESLKRNGVDTQFVFKHKDIPSNHHYVLWYGDERTILIKHEAYPYTLPDIGVPEWIYLSSLSEHSLPYHEEIAGYVAAHQSIKLAFQPGTFQISLGAEKLQSLYTRSEIFFCNSDEARRILKTNEQDIKKLLTGIRSLGPRIAVITEGPRGAYASNAKETWFMPSYPDPKPPYDRTGAGDAFASTVVIALALGKTLPEALSWGPVNSMSVVQQIGAQKGLLTRQELTTFLEQAPSDYKPQRIS